jgi:hypothetical protein
MSKGLWGIFHFYTVCNLLCKNRSTCTKGSALSPQAAIHPRYFTTSDVIE